MVNVLQHVLLRSNNNELLFCHSHDYRVFSDYLKQTAQQFDCAIHAYVYMPDHVHLLLTPSHEKSISKLVQLQARRYVQYFNRRYHRYGNLFETRYKSSLVDSDYYALHCYQYIESNPVRAGLVDSPEAYNWSSYRRNALGLNDELISSCKEYGALGDSGKQRQIAYKNRLEKALSPEIMHAIRLQTQRSLPLGEASFINHLEHVFGLSLQAKARGGDHRSMQFRALSRA